MSAVPAIRILIAEDQPVVRRGIAMLLSVTPDMECVGQACDGEEAVTLAALLRPDVILMDLHMPKKGGASATRDITRTQPGPQILVLTTLDDDEAVFQAVRAGASGFLLKDASEDELLETIREMRRGESRLAPSIARRVSEQFAKRIPTRAARAQPDVTDGAASGLLSVPAGGTTMPLTKTESELLALATRGADSREMALKVALPEDLIKRHVCQILQKFHTLTRLEWGPRARGERE